MIKESRLRAIEARARAIATMAITLTNNSDGTVELKAGVGGDSVDLRVMRDLDPAAKGDVVFVGRALSDVSFLIEAVRSRERLEPVVLQTIKDRIASASPAPWFAFIESDGGQAGCDVMRVSESDDEPDMYLWLGSDLAPSSLFRFVAGARQDTPELIAAIESDAID